MRFAEAPLRGAFVIKPQRMEDERGFFAATWTSAEAQRHGIDALLPEGSISWNALKGTLRGMHFQAAPHREAKLVSCTSGSVFDVIVDLRDDSPSRHRWFGVELSAANRLLLYVPEGLAHGYLTLEDATEVSYRISCPYHAEASGGVRWDDPAFGIKWPERPLFINHRDASYPDVRREGPRP